jgi:hypothetical protein
MSQADMAYDILTKAPKPLHATELLERIGKSFQVTVDRESLVSALTKKVMRGDRFIRTGKNTLGVGRARLLPSRWKRGWTFTEPWNEVFPQNRTALARDARGWGLVISSWTIL